MNGNGSLADALAGGGKFIKWKEIGRGVAVSGTVTDVKMRQTRKLKFQNGVYIDEGPANWDDGSPKMEAVIELATALRENADDDGARSISVNMWSGQKRALADACRKAGVPEPRPGDTFTAVWASGAGDPGDPREFAYTVTPGSGLGGQLADATPAPEFTAAPAAPAAPAAAPSKPEQVKALHAAGLPAEQIAAVTGFTPEQVAALINLP